MVQHVCRHITQRPTDHLRDSHFQAGEVWRLSSSQIKQTSALLPSVCQHFCMNVLKRSVRSLERCTAAEPDPPPGRRQIVWRHWRPSLCSAWSFGADAPPPSPPAWETSAGSQRWLSHFCHYCGEADTVRGGRSQNAIKSVNIDLPESVYESFREISSQSRWGCVETCNLREAGPNVQRTSETQPSEAAFT